MTTLHSRSELMKTKIDLINQYYGRTHEIPAKINKLLQKRRTMKVQMLKEHIEKQKKTKRRAQSSI